MPVSSKGKIHDVFNDNLRKLSEDGLAMAEAVAGEGNRPWQMPEDLADPLDVPGITEPFDREEIDSNYEEALADGKAPGTVGDVVSLKAQLDHVSQMERGFRARHCTPIRCIALASGRRRGHGDPQGVLLGGVVKYAQDALAAGQGRADE